MLDAFFARGHHKPAAILSRAGDTTTLSSSVPREMFLSVPALDPIAVMDDLSVMAGSALKSVDNREHSQTFACNGRDLLR